MEEGCTSTVVNGKLVKVAVVHNVALGAAHDLVEAFGPEFAKEVANSPTEFADMLVGYKTLLLGAARYFPEEIGRNFHIDVDIAAEDNHLERYSFLVQACRKFDRLVAGNEIHLLGHMTGL